MNYDGSGVVGWSDIFPTVGITISKLPTVSNFLSICFTDNFFNQNILPTIFVGNFLRRPSAAERSAVERRDFNRWALERNAFERKAF